MDLGNGVKIQSKLSQDVEDIHRTRIDMIMPVIEQHFAGRLSNISCIDIGCHEGYFAFAMARRGLRNVLGIDVREDSLEKANFIADVLRLGNVSFRYGNCEELSRDVFGDFELCLFVGLLYHLENPILALRRAYEVTGEMLVIETQVIDSIQGSTEWGSREWHRPYQGIMALIDETPEYAAGNEESGNTPISVCPSIDALMFMLRKVGFKRSELIEPPAGAYEQHARKKRVVVAAYK